MDQQFMNNILTQYPGQNQVNSWSKPEEPDYTEYREIESVPVVSHPGRKKTAPVAPQWPSRAFSNALPYVLSTLAGVVALFVAGWLFFQLLTILWLAVLDAWLVVKRWLVESGAAVGAALLLVIYGIYRMGVTWPAVKRKPRDNGVVPFDFETGGKPTSGGPTIIHNYFFNTDNQQDK